MPLRWTAPTLLALLTTTALRAQAVPTAAYVVSVDGREAGQERIGRGVGRDGGPVLRVETVPVAPPPLTALLSRAAGGQQDVLQLEIRHPEGTETVRATPGPGRITVSSSGTGTRRTRELPASGRVLLLDEAAHGLLLAAAEAATPEGTELTGIYVRSGRRVRFTAIREVAKAGGAPSVRLTGELNARLRFEPDGRLDRLELPDARTVLSRLPD
ncbi:MAG: hypothetical protein MUC69_01455 [Gemmatimonadales bacterium]|nr:hypothetical protein [Gemmatimonadales bacterium]